jgi:hypothetical protein
MLRVRQIGLGVLAVAAIAVFFGMAPEVEDETAGEAYIGLIELAESINEDNAARTESAPQQQVVNGWYANDLLNIIALEGARTASQSSDDRSAALLLIGVLAIALWGATSVPRSAQAASPPVPILSADTAVEVEHGSGEESEPRL